MVFNNHFFLNLSLTFYLLKNWTVRKTIVHGGTITGGTVQIFEICRHPYILIMQCVGVLQLSAGVPESVVQDVTSQPAEHVAGERVGQCVLMRYHPHVKAQRTLATYDTFF